MYLLDTNILLELLLDQEKASDVDEFLRAAPAESLYISTFSLYSLGVILLRHKLQEQFFRLFDDLVLSGGVRVVHLQSDEIRQLESIWLRFRLTFDDAYQYLSAARANLNLVSFDADFDRTDRGRNTPAELIARGL